MTRTCIAMTVVRFSFAGGVLLPTVVSEASILVAQHVGATDPANEGFDVNLGGNAQVGPVIGDLGLDAWSIDLDGGVAFYRHSLTATEQTSAASAGWTMSLRLRMVEFPVTLDGMFAEFYTGANRFLLRFEAQSDGDPIVYAGLYPDTQFFVLEGGGAAYHDYALTFRPETGTATLSVDGVGQLDDVKGRPSGSAARFDWGGAQTTAHANWNEASLAIVPEPATLVLLAAGLLRASRRTRRRLHAAGRPARS